MEEEIKDCPKCGGELGSTTVGDETYDMCSDNCGYYEA